MVVAGFFAVRFSLKMAGYPHDPTVNWNSFSVFLRNFGFWFIVLPLVWTIYAVAAHQTEKGVLSFRPALLTGFILAVCIAGLFTYGAVFPFTRPMLWFFAN